MIAVAIAIASQGVHALEKTVKLHPTAVNRRALGDAYVRSRMFGRASDEYFKAGELLSKAGDGGAAKVLRTLGERYETTINLFVERPHRLSSDSGIVAGAKYEPYCGCYLGAFIDRENAIDSGFIGNGQSHKDPSAFNDATGKHHAIYFTYLAYGRPFPTRWISVLRQRGAAAQIAWEPRSTSVVRDDGYLREFALECGNSRMPIFLRFAGEMNGDWTPYHRDPAAYKAMFRTVARVMHRLAPNVAMVWCPNAVPEDRIAGYYPGKDAVDWVGVNFYSVLYYDGDKRRPAQWRNPIDCLRFVYDAYSRDHPIMVCEWAASHRSIVDNRPRPDFAIEKIAELYTAVPRLYPRVKAINWLSLNTIEHALPGRQLNDFSLLGDSSVTAEYKEVVSSPYFLESVPDTGSLLSPIDYAPVTNGLTLSGKLRLSAVVKSYDPRPSVVWTVDGDPSSPKKEPGAYEVFLDASKLKSKEAVISVAVRDSRGDLAGRRDVIVKVAG